jgi:AcrR family transcriptional regulator
MNIIEATDDVQAPPTGKDVTRRRLVEAAAEVIAERGYHAASLSDIAARAGLTTGAVYSAFGSKKELLLAVCRDASTSVDGEFAALLTSGLGLREILEQIVAKATRVVDAPETRRLVTLQLEIFQLGLRDESVFRLLSADVRQEAADLARLLEAAASQDGTRLPMPAKELASILVQTLNGLGQLRLVDRDLAPESLFIRAIEAIFGWEPRQPQ